MKKSETILFKAFHVKNETGRPANLFEVCPYLMMKIFGCIAETFTQFILRGISPVRI
jgi:hypothetical protein